MDPLKKTYSSSKVKVSNDPLKKTGKTTRKGALELHEKQSSLAPEVHKKSENNLQMGFFTASHILANSVITSTKEVIDIYEFAAMDKIIHWCENENPKYIMLDIDSPTSWSDAMDVLSNVLTLNQELKLIILTRMPKSGMVKQMIKKGAYAVLKKPFSADGLLEVII